MQGFLTILLPHQVSFDKNNWFTLLENNVGNEIYFSNGIKGPSVVMQRERTPTHL